MDRWTGKIAVVTGASAGIGEEIVKILVENGLTVIGFARRKSVMEDNMKNFKGKGKFYAKDCDVSQEESVIEAFNFVRNTFGTVNILINNAGAIQHKTIEEAATADLDRIIDVNLKGVLYCIKQAIKLMNDNKNEAHIININSVLGHMIPPPGLVSFNVYPASKYAVTAFTETLRNELRSTKIRVTSVSPGLVKTQMMTLAGSMDSNYLKKEALEPIDVADAVVYVLGAPPRVEINELTLQAKH